MASRQECWVFFANNPRSRDLIVLAVIPRRFQEIKITRKNYITCLEKRVECKTRLATQTEL